MRPFCAYVLIVLYFCYDSQRIPFFECGILPFPGNATVAISLREVMGLAPRHFTQSILATRNDPVFFRTTWPNVMGASQDLSSNRTTTTSCCQDRRGAPAEFNFTLGGIRGDASGGTISDWDLAWNPSLGWNMSYIPMVKPARCFPMPIRTRNNIQKFEETNSFANFQIICKLVITNLHISEIVLNFPCNFSLKIR